MDVSKRLAAAALLLVLVAFGQASRADGPFETPVTVDGAVERTMQAHNGKEYRIFIATPVEQAPPHGWPVVYLLDGNAWFTAAVQQSRLLGREPAQFGTLPALVVGIGYPGERYFNMARRVPDFTPPATVREPQPEGWPAPGGADEFLDFIDKELKPAIAREYKVDPERQVLFGHSLGGLLVLHALFTRPDSFETFGAASSSIWWNDDYILEEAKAFAARTRDSTRRAPRLLLAVGGNELADMVRDSERLNRALRPLHGRGLDLHFAKIEGEDHVTVVPPVLSRLLKVALKPAAGDVAAYQVKLLDAKAPVFTDPAEYLALTPAQRTKIRIDVRKMSAEERKAYNERMYDLIHNRMTVQEYAMLKAERVLEDRRNGTVPVME